MAQDFTVIGLTGVCSRCTLPYQSHHLLEYHTYTRTRGLEGYSTLCLSLARSTQKLRRDNRKSSRIYQGYFVFPQRGVHLARLRVRSCSSTCWGRALVPCQKDRNTGGTPQQYWYRTLYWRSDRIRT